MTGMSQKNGSVTSHVRFSDTPGTIFAARIPSGEADLILGCDLLTAGAHDALSKMRAGRTTAIINRHQQPTGLFAKQPDWQFPEEAVTHLIGDAVGERTEFIDATAIATALLGDSIATNLFMLGYAYQRGCIPVSEKAITRAIELNGVAVEANKKSFAWGRHAAVDLRRVQSVAAPAKVVTLHFPPSLDRQIEERVEELTAYQNAAYARKYLNLVDRVRSAEGRIGQGTKLTAAVSRYYFKLMTYKDEYEVARLYTDGRFKASLKRQFEGNVSLRFNLAPPLFAKRDAHGCLVKREYGQWLWYAFHVLARLRFLRGTTFDMFGFTNERKMERELIEEYRASIEALLNNLSESNLSDAVELASWPEHVRGFGHVKDASIAALSTRRSVAESVDNHSQGERFAG
jgi:indolepyruvate ferredoxin oxidoreductase